MRFIGNIVTKTNFDINKRFNMVESYDDILPGLPTLIIGYQNTKALYPTFRVSEHKINDSVFWGFAKNEDRDKFNTAIMTFIDYCFKGLVKNIKYLYIDPIHYSREKLNKISKKLNNTENAKGLIINDHIIYIYCDNIIYGFDTEICGFAGISKEKLVNKFSKLTGGFLNYNMILIEYGNDITALNDSIRYLPFLYSIDNE